MLDGAIFFRPKVLAAIERISSDGLAARKKQFTRCATDV
jgi:hypothetical protein